MLSTLRRVLRSAAAPIVVAAVAIAQLAPGLVHGLSPPISWDHGAHLGKAILTARELLPSLRGWSDSVEAGVPLNTLYSLGGTAYLLLVRALTPFLEWHQTYAIAIAGFRVLLGLSVVRLARVVGVGRFASCVAGVVALADVGDHSEGGWFYDIQFGVWPMSLAMVWLVLGLAEFLGARRADATASTVRGAFFWGAALITHQMAMIGLLVLAPVFVLARWLDDELDDRVARLLLGVALGGLLAAFWVLPMLAGAAEMSRHGQVYQSFSELGANAIGGGMVLRGGPFTAVLAALAVLTAPFTRGDRRFLGLAVLVLLVASARDWAESCGLLRVAPSLGAIMYPRFLMIAKPLEFVLVGSLVDELVRRLAPVVREQVASRRGRVGVALALALLTPFVPGLARGAYESVLLRPTTYAFVASEWQAFRAYAEWERSHARDPYYRVAYELPTTHLAQAGGAYTGRPAHKIGTLIAEVFRNTSPTGDVSALREMNVRRIVHTGRLHGALARATHEVARFGPLVVSDLDGWTSAIATGDANGDPAVLSASHERLEIEPRGARSIVVRRAFARRWRAYVDGVAVRVRPEPVAHAAPLTFQRIEVPAGARRVVLDYASVTPVDVGGATLSLLTCSALLVPVARRHAAAVLSAATARALVVSARLREPRSRVALALVVALAILGGLVLRATRFDARSAYADARVDIVRSDGSVVVCDGRRAEGRDGRACPDAEWIYVGPVVQAVDGELRECVWSHPPAPGDTLRIRFPSVPLDDGLTFSAGIGDEAQLSETASVDFEVGPEGGETTRLRVGPHEWRSLRIRGQGRGPVVVRVHAADATRRFACFSLRP